MPQIATYEDWISRSNYDWRHPRSNHLQELDKKVKYYFANWKGNNHEIAKRQCMEKFEWYVKLKWAEDPKNKPVGVMGITLSKNNPRNKTGAFDDLRTTMLTNNFVVDSSMQEAQNIVMAAQANMLESLFKSKTGVPLQFTCKNVSVIQKFKNGINSVAVTVKAPVNGGKAFKPGQYGNNPNAPDSLGTAKQKITTGVRAGYQVGKAYTDVKDVMKIAGGQALETPAQHSAAITKELAPILGQEIAGHVGHAVGEVVPIIGHILVGVKLVKAIVDVVQVHMLKSDLENISNMGYVAPGAPSAALDAVSTLYTRIAVQKDINLGMCTAKFGAQFDPTRTAASVVGAADAARKIIELIALLIMELKEIKAANDMITRGLYKRHFEDMFVACPLLGAYVIVGSDTSSIINVAVKFYGTNGWQVSVENLRKSTEKLYKASRSLIQNSKFEIQGFPKTPMAKKDIPQSAVSLGVRGGMAHESYNPNSMGRERSDAVTSAYVRIKRR